MPKVFVTRQIPAKGLEIAGADAELEIWPERMPPPYETLLEKVRGVDGLLCLLTDKIDAKSDGCRRVLAQGRQPDGRRLR